MANNTGKPSHNAAAAPTELNASTLVPNLTIESPSPLQIETTNVRLGSVDVIWSDLIVAISQAGCGGGIQNCRNVLQRARQELSKTDLETLHTRVKQIRVICESLSMHSF